jgi:hypothetical protein
MNIEICKKCEKLNNVDAFTFVADLQGGLFIPTIMDEDNEPICKMTAMFLRDCNPYNTLYKDIKPLSGCPYLFEHQLSDWNE